MNSMRSGIKTITACLLSVIGFMSCGLSVYGRVTTAYTPVSADTVLLWAEKFGRTYRDAPSDPIVIGDYMVLMSGKRLMKISKKDGSVAAETQLAEALGFGCAAPTYDDGTLYCPTDNGAVEAYDFATLERLWVYHDVLGGQSLTKVVADGHRLYTGFWNDEDENASFVCIDSLNGRQIWSIEKKGGFYWAGCAVVDDYVVFGSDDGTVYDDRNSLLFLADKYTGTILDTAETVGDIRSSVTYNEANGRVYCTAKSGLLYSFRIENGKFIDKKTLDLSGASTSTPTVAGSRLYVGAQGAKQRGRMCVIDADSLALLYTVETRGYPQNEQLASISYGGVNYVYFTYNNNPGGLSVLVDLLEVDSGSVHDIFIPGTGQTGYCISAVACDDKGNLYYKNDSGTVFAVADRNDINGFMQKINIFIKKIFTLIADFCKIFV